MPISVSCDTCGRAYRLKDAAAGKTIRCKDCENPIKVPSADADEIEEYGDDEWGDSAHGTDDFGGLPPATGRSSKSGLPPSPQKKKKKRPSSRSSSNASPLAKQIGGGLLVLLAVLGIAARVMRAVNRVGGLDFGGGGYSWQDYSPAGTPLKMLMPGTPVEGTQFSDGISMKTATVEIQRPKSAFGFTYADVPVPPGAQLDVDTGLVGAKQGMLQRLPSGSQVTNERAVSLTDTGGNVHRGREVTIHAQVDGDKVEFVYRFYFVSRQMAILFTVVPVDEAGARRADTGKFLDSLAVTASVPSAG